MRFSSLLVSLVASTIAAASEIIQSPLEPRSLLPCLNPTKPRSEYVVSKDGLKLYSEGVGCKTGIPLIYVTGFGSAHIAFDKLWNDPELRDRLYMVRFDPRGHGLTDKPVDPAAYESERYADDVKAIVATYQLDKPFFAGWSLGASMAVDIAQYYDHPLPFSGFLSFAGLPYTSVLLNCTQPTVQALVPGLLNDTSATTALQTRVDYAGILSIKKKQVKYEDLSAWTGTATYMPPAVASLTLFRTQDPTKFFEEGAKGWPVKFIFGDHDTSVNLTSVLEVMKPFKNQETVVIKDSGHISFYDTPEKVKSALLPFVYKYYGKSY